MLHHPLASGMGGNKVSGVMFSVFLSFFGMGRQGGLFVVTVF